MCFHLINIDERKENKAYQCPECNCKNTWGSYEYSGNGNYCTSETIIPAYTSVLSLYSLTLFRNVHYHASMIRIVYDNFHLQARQLEKSN